MNNPVLILHLEDDPRDAEQVRDKLQQITMACELRVASDRAEYEAALAQTRFDLILSDYSLPGYDGMAALAKARAEQPDVPFILISGTLGEEQAVDCVLRGATDFVLKQHLDRLVPAVLRALTEVEERRKRRKIEEALRESERRLSETQKMAQLGHWVWDVKTGQVEWSKEVFNIFRLDPGKFTPRIDSILALSPWPEDHERDQELIRKAIASHEKGSYDQRFLRPDGSTGYYHSTFQGKYDDGGDLISIVGTVQDITERRQAEEKLRASELEFRSLAEAMPQIVWVTRPDGWNIYFNQQWVDYTGLTLEESYGHGWNKPFHPDDRQRAWDAWQNATQNDAPYALECRLRRADGSYRWWLIRGVPLREAGGKILKWFGTCTDIEDIKQAEAALRLAHERLHRFFDSNVAGIVIANAAGAIIEANDYYLCLIGYTREELEQGKIDWRAITPPEWLPADEQAIRELRERGACSPYEKEYVRRDGTRVMVLLADKMLPGPGEQMAAFVLDITQRKRAEEALRRSETQLQATLEATADGILAVDNTGKVVKANRRFADLWRVPESLMERGDDQALLEFVLDQLSKPDEFLEKVQLLYRSTEVDLDTLVFKDGRDFERFSFPMMMEGAVIGRVWSFRDITERKRAEVALRQSARELQERNDELQRFAYTVSHDLKSPLVTIQTFAGYLERDMRNQDSAQIEKDMKFIRGAADKMSRLLSELLDLSRVGRKMNPFVNVPLQTVVQEALALVAGRIAERGVTVHVTTEPVLLHGDRARLVEVFQNLVDNAVKFMGDQSAPRVEIGVEQIEKEPVFFVRDNGGGIDPRHQAKLFGLFEKLDPRSEGTGIGLALVKRIVEVHGGKIWAESAGLGQGATFRFTLGSPGLPGPETPPTPPV